MRVLALVAILLIGGCAGWRTTASRTLNGLTAAGKEAHAFILARCGPGGRTAAEACLAKRDGECKALKRCEAATRVTHSLQTAVLVAKLAVRASEKPSALKAVQAAVAAMVPVAAAIKGWMQ